MIFIMSNTGMNSEKNPAIHKKAGDTNTLK